uniref:Bifunctional inhibitor/plant lipid transfer protein/seed storage helical domain-containing protein n=1 Tax=Oryza punctata TaxID=4537 RepID=A0A0E0ML08_ORYPU
MVSCRVAAAGGLLLLLLLVAQQASAQAAQMVSASAAVQPSTKKKPPQQPKIRKCTEAQKQDILRECRGYVTMGFHITLPDLHSPCCDAARSVQNLDMDCIVDLLTSEETSRKRGRRGGEREWKVSGVAALANAVGAFWQQMRPGRQHQHLCDSGLSDNLSPDKLGKR